MDSMLQLMNQQQHMYGCRAFGFDMSKAYIQPAAISHSEQEKGHSLAQSMTAQAQDVLQSELILGMERDEVLIAVTLLVIPACK